jgi:hypothetical protein
VPRADDLIVPFTLLSIRAVSKMGILIGADTAMAKTYAEFSIAERKDPAWS